MGDAGQGGVAALGDGGVAGGHRVVDLGGHLHLHTTHLGTTGAPQPDGQTFIISAN